jgi:hypothetical protein
MAYEARIVHLLVNDSWAIYRLVLLQTYRKETNEAVNERTN